MSETARSALSTSEIDRQDGRRHVGAAVISASLLILAGVATVAVAAMGVVEPAQPGTLTAVTVANWLTVLPGVIGLVLAAPLPLASLALTSAAGIAGLLRLIADIGVVVQPEQVSRPELLLLTDPDAYPLRVSGAATLLLAIDVLVVVVGVIAARSFGAAIQDRNLLGDHSAALENEPAAPKNAEPADSMNEDQRWPSGEVQVSRNGAIVAGGFAALALTAGSAASVPYRGGYVSAIFGLAGTDLFSLLAPMALVIIGIAALILARSLPRSLAVALLGGVASAAAVPQLVALVVAADRPEVETTASPWWALGGLVGLTLSGLLTKVDWSNEASAPSTAMTKYNDREPRTKLQTNIAAGLALLSGIVAAVGAASPLLLTGGSTEPLGANGLRTESGFGLPIASFAFLMVIAGLAALAPRLAAGGRNFLLVTWAAGAVALAAPVDALSKLRSIQSQAAMEIDASGGAGVIKVAEWSGGRGFSLTVLAAVLAVAAAIVAGIAQLSADDEAAAVLDDDVLANSGRRRTWVAVGVGIIAIVALSFRPYTTTSGGAGSLLALGGEGGWTVLLLLAALVIAAVAAVVANTRVTAAAGLLAGAAVVAIRQFVPDSISASPGFATGPGQLTGWLLVAVLIIGGVVVAAAIPAASAPSRPATPG